MADTISKTWESLVSEKKRRVLFIVDGDTSYLYYTGMLLQRLNYNIYTTRMAEEALEIIKFAVPMLVLTEISLQGMDGIELLRQIKQDPRTKSVPVIVYTASTEQSLKYICQDAGCDAFLRKPFDPDELYAAVQGATEDKPRRYVRLQ
ncbi:MAG TPA: response regulator, partial [Nitrospirota bacterium]|nr:response regulator [Nitrospirota bacterium]